MANESRKRVRNGAAPQPLGVVLAGGAGRRLGGAKAVAGLGGRPLIAWALEALGAVCAAVVVTAKPDTPLPDLGPVPVWRETTEVRHPLCGVLAALERAEGRSVLACPLDLPFVAGELLLRLRDAPESDGRPVLAAGQPLLGRYGAACTPALAAAVGANASVRGTLARLGARELAVSDPDRALFNVNTAADLAAAEAFLARSP